MKKSISLALLLLSLAIAIPAQAQLKLGVKAGTNFTKLSLDTPTGALEAAKGSLAGFTGGVMAEVTIPILGIGVDASVMYSRYSSELPTIPALEDLTSLEFDPINKDCIDIPINLKWKIGIPMFKAFVAAGPNFTFLMNDKLTENIRTKSNYEMGINLGGGVELFNKLQVALQYNWGITEHEYEFDLDVPGADLIGGVALPSIEGYKAKSNYWTLTAAYLF